MKFSKRKREIAIRKDKEAVINMLAVLYRKELEELKVSIERDIRKYKELLPSDSEGLRKLQGTKIAIQDAIYRMKKNVFNEHGLSEEEIAIFNKYYS